MVKNITLGLIALLIFTQGLIFLHSSSFEKKNYDSICNSIYTEKTWINLCYFPFNQEIATFTLARTLEIAGIILSLVYISPKWINNVLGHDSRISNQR